MTLTVLGDLAWDVLIRTNSELLTGGDTFGEVVLAPGGSAANVAVWASRCGLATRFIGKIGRDNFGHLAEEQLKQEQVDVHVIRTRAYPTASIAVWIDHNGERSMVSGKGADFYLLPSELPQVLLEQTTHLHLTAWSLFTDPPRAAACRAAAVAKRAGATLSLDPGSFQMIGEMGVDRFLAVTTPLRVDVLFPNFEEGQILSSEREPEAIVHKLAELYEGALIALKLDAQGALLLEGGKLIPIAPATQQLIDATGAGDSFAGAFLTHYLTQQDARQAGEFACQISAWVIERLGGQAPVDTTLRTLLASHSPSTRS
ncbi:MAG: carbohydrate kinase family protein [Deinococcota bacterium]